MFVAGRVLDPQGKPVPNATTMVYAVLKQPLRSDRPERMAPPVIGEAIERHVGPVPTRCGTHILFDP